MKRYLNAILKIELDPVSLFLAGMVLAGILITAAVLNEKVQSVYDYAMEDPEMYFPAL
jgi:hypothetical protein